MINDDPEFFAVPAGDIPVAAEPPEVFLLPATGSLRLYMLADWRDQLGEHYYPNIQVQCRAWNDDTVTSWINFSGDDFVVSRDTIIVHLDRLMVMDAQMGGANFSFRARLSSAGVQTDWVRTHESIRLYPEKRRGIPRQPRELRVIH